MTWKVVNIQRGGRAGIQAAYVDGKSVVVRGGRCGHVIRAAGQSLPCDRPAGHGGMHSALMGEK